MRFERTSGGFITLSPCPAGIERKFTQINKYHLRPFLRTIGFRSAPNGTFRKVSPTHIWVISPYRMWGRPLPAYISVELGVYHPSWVTAIEEVICGDMLPTNTPYPTKCLVCFAELCELAGEPQSSWGSLAGGKRADAVGQRLTAALAKHALDWFKENSHLPHVVDRLANRPGEGSWHRAVYTMCGYAALGNLTRAVDFYQAAKKAPPPWRPTSQEKRALVARLDKWAADRLSAA